MSVPPPSVPPHPYGVQPEGNLWLLEPGAAAAAAAARAAGLGELFASLDDPTILRIVGHAGEPATLSALGATSRTLAAFSSSEELWQSACLRRAAGEGYADFRLENTFAGFCGGSWRETYMKAARARIGVQAPTSEAMRRRREAAVAAPPIFSDTLYRPHELAHAPSAFGASPSGPPCARTARCCAIAEDASSSSPPRMDAAEFSSTYESGDGRPVVLEGLGAKCAARSAWDEAPLRERLGERVFHAGGVNMRLREYLDYAGTNSDDQPLYCFDPTFGTSAPELLEEYEVPPYFRDDLFKLLDGDGGARPAYRWLLIGGLRSGQSWHKDPNGTSAWNLTVRGRKRWLFFPPNVTPPGVIMSGDGDDTDFITPISLAEWAREFYGDACSTPGFLECETGPGDVMYVPRGWWHMVLNVEPLTIAVSHHFLSPTGLSNTLRVLRETPHQVSGIDRGLAPRDESGAARPDAAEEDHRRRTKAGRDMHDRLVAALRRERPEVLDMAEERLRREREGVERKRERLDAHKELFRSRKKALVAPGDKAEADPVPFAFNFA